MEGGRFRIQTVAEMTGVGASTLRAWEQRYGFPAPERSASAYRLYSDHDVQRILRVRELCDAGMAASDAVALVLGTVTPQPVMPPTSTVTPPVPSGSPAIDRVLAAVHAGDPTALDEALRAPLLVAAPRDALVGVIEPAWSGVRTAWREGALDRGQERIAAELFGHVVRDLVRLGQPPRPRGHAVLACFADDDDLVPLGRIALGAQAHGMRAVWLGPRTSAAAIGAAAHRLDARLVALACGEATTASRARELVDDYARAIGRRAWIVCGPDDVAEIARRRGAVIAGDDASLQTALAALG